MYLILDKVILLCVISIHKIVANFLWIVEIGQATFCDFELIICDGVNVQGKVQEKHDWFHSCVAVDEFQCFPKPCKLGSWTFHGGGRILNVFVRFRRM